MQQRRWDVKGDVILSYHGSCRWLWLAVDSLGSGAVVRAVVSGREGNGEGIWGSGQAWCSVCRVVFVFVVSKLSCEIAAEQDE